MPREGSGGGRAQGGGTRAGSVPGAVGFDAYAALNADDERAMEGLEVPEGARVVTVCNRGRAAAAAAEQLRRQGHDAVHLEGGMDAWRAL